MLHRLIPAVAGLAVALACGQAAAQNKDTIRVAVHQPVPIIDPIYNPSPETGLISNIVYDSLVHFDGDKRDYVPLSARS